MKDRHPVSENKQERFVGLMYSLLDLCELNEIPDVIHYADLTAQAVERYLFDSKYSSNQSKTSVKRKRFITIFKNRYVALTDMEYPRSVTAVDAKMIGHVIETLDGICIDVDEYLSWVFDVFLEANPKFCPPMIKVICSGFVMDKFLFENKERIKQKKQEDITNKLVMDIIGRARILIRFFDENADIKGKIIQALNDYKTGKINLESLRQEVEVHEKTMKDKEVIV